MEELKRCPFCGEEVITSIEVNQGTLGQIYFDFAIVCKCGIEMHSTLSSSLYVEFEEVTKKINEVIERWNNRN